MLDIDFMLFPRTNPNEGDRNMSTETVQILKKVLL